MTPRTLISTFTLALFVSFAASACSPSADERRSAVEREKNKYARISAQRRPGSACSENDAASVKRYRPFKDGNHWTYAPRVEGCVNLIDPNVTPRTWKGNQLELLDGKLCGFVKFDGPGYLRARIYDDYFGDILCGWNDEILRLEPSSRPVFVRVGLAGDFTDTFRVTPEYPVSEVAWFPDGLRQGTIIYSSAHSPKCVLGPLAYYRRAQLGHGNTIYARTMIEDGIKNSDLKFSDQVAADAFKMFVGVDRLESMSFILGRRIGSSEYVSLYDKFLKLLNASKLEPQTDSRAERRLASLETFSELYKELGDYVRDEMPGRKTIVVTKNPGSFWSEVSKKLRSRPSPKAARLANLIDKALAKDDDGSSKRSFVDDWFEMGARTVLSSPRPAKNDSVMHKLNNHR
ncbi:MAG: hypothetical protein K2W95_07565 [Candidatus Obscuribacterales bacterium]|nr:hypothetical protein [Candidatus Obscuribacterales bacterium]